MFGPRAHYSSETFTPDFRDFRMDFRVSKDFKKIRDRNSFLEF